MAEKNSVVKPYIKPTTVIVRLNVSSSILDFDMMGRSKGSTKAAAWGKGNNFDEEEEETPVGTVGSNKSLWDD